MNWTTVVCGIIEKDNTFLCCQRSETMNLPLQWEFPGGKCEKGENLKSALARELFEELNLIATIGDIVETSLHDKSGIKLIAFGCHVSNFESFKLHEHKAYKWLPKNKLSILNWAEADLPIVKKLITD